MSPGYRLHRPTLQIITPGKAVEGSDGQIEGRRYRIRCKGAEGSGKVLGKSTEGIRKG